MIDQAPRRRADTPVGHANEWRMPAALQDPIHPSFAHTTRVWCLRTKDAPQAKAQHIHPHGHPPKPQQKSPDIHGHPSIPQSFSLIDQRNLMLFHRELLDDSSSGKLHEFTLLGKNTSFTMSPQNMLLLLFASLTSIILTNCDQALKDKDGADILFYFEDVTPQEKKMIESRAGSFTPHFIKHGTTHSVFSNQFTLRIWLKDPGEFIHSRSHELLIKAINEAKAPSDYIENTQDQ